MQMGSQLHAPDGFDVLCKGIVYHLLRQGGRVDNHTVLATGFGNQRHLNIVTLCQSARDQAAGFGGAGKHHRLNAAVRHYGFTHFTAAGYHRLYHMLG